MDIRALAHIVWEHELDAHRQIIERDIAVAQGATAADLIQITVDGERNSAEQYLHSITAEGGLHCTSIRTGPAQALVLSTRAVLLTYPLAAHLAGEGEMRIDHEYASILWMQRAGQWLTVWTHATPILSPADQLARAGDGKPLIDCTVAGEEIAGDVAAEDLTLDDLTLGEHKWEAIACEQASVANLLQHDVLAAEAATAADAIVIGTDGSRGGRNDWLALVGDWRRSLAATDFGPMQVIAATPNAMLVVYTLDTHGAYDGAPYLNREAISSLWLRWGGRWQNIFIQATPRLER